VALCCSDVERCTHLEETATRACEDSIIPKSLVLKYKVPLLSSKLESKTVCRAGLEEECSTEENGGIVAEACPTIDES
jgi:hypothetical protein